MGRINISVLFHNSVVAENNIEANRYWDKKDSDDEQRTP